MSEHRPCIDAFALGDYQTNCYIVTVPDSHQPEHCWVVDCGLDPEPMLDHIARHRLQPQALLLTHCHLDHIAGIDALLSRFGSMPIYAHRAEAEWNGDPMLNLSALAGRPITVTAPDHLLDGGETMELLGTNWQVIHTPGHSPGGVCFVHEPSQQAIVGDTLFAGSIGRMDFPTSNADDLRRSIHDVIMHWPDDMTIYPGHGPQSTIGQERQSNPFVVQGF
jgi:hydroxyacylglutathione hydrolase